MASDFNAKARTIANMTARSVVDEIQNRGIGLTFEEAQQVAVAAGSGIELYCKGCGHELTSDEAEAERCGLCGSRVATTAPVYRCANPRCTAPVSIKQESCLKCGGTQATKANGPVVTVRNPRPCYTCTDCLGRVALEDDECPHCGGTRAYKTVTR